jgi:hypothetical protein
MAIVINTTAIPGTTIVYDNAVGGVAIDYSTFYERTASAAERTAASTDAIQALLTSIEVHIERIKVLADPNEPGDSSNGASGIRVSAPYAALDRALLWAGLFATENDIWNVDNPPSAAALQGYLDSARAFVNAFELEFPDLK